MLHSRSAQAGTCRYLTAITMMVLLGLPCPTVGAGDRIFSIPIGDLRLWSEKIIVPIDVVITGNSGVHPKDQDCEMHFGARSEAYKGEPAGLVLEPMNLCVQPFFGKTQYAKVDWTNFGSMLKGKTAHVKGVPRIWPEHLVGNESTSNPHHAVELHPVTFLTRGTVNRDFSSFIFDPPDYEGGLKPETALRVLTKTVVSVSKQDDMAQVSFDSGRIGNFTFLHFTILKNTIEEAEGGHRMDGEVQGEANEIISVRLVTVAGSPVDKAVAKLKNRSGQRFGMDALVLLSLSPEALLKAALESTGGDVKVPNPFQLIVYGEEDTED